MEIIKIRKCMISTCTQARHTLCDTHSEGCTINYILDRTLGKRNPHGIITLIMNVSVLDRHDSHLRVYWALSIGVGTAHNHSPCIYFNELLCLQIPNLKWGCKHKKDRKY